jgi:hypothetical protein
MVIRVIILVSGDGMEWNVGLARMSCDEMMRRVTSIPQLLLH